MPILWKKGFKGFEKFQISEGLSCGRKDSEDLRSFKYLRSCLVEQEVDWI